ncbi:hypothetical protein ACFYM7_30670 [Streptomyces cyaneofuscatus]|uniref:hypothetical protein n=1 Tax=Streptomyces cyaneofuscatus TaxID=66883 RepID=UPI0036BDD7C3
MTLNPALAAMGPMGLVATSAANTVYSIVKDLNSGISIETSSPAPVDAVPDALKDALVDTDLGERALHGVFYTHSRFQPLIRHVKGVREMMRRHGGGNVPASAADSHSIFMILPLRMSYNAVQLDMTHAREELMKKADESYAAMDRINLDKEQNEVMVLQDRVDRLTRSDSVDARRLRSQLAHHQQRIEAYEVHGTAAERLVRESRRLRDLSQLVWMKNFRIQAVEQVNGIKGKTAAGLHGKGSMVVTTKPMHGGIGVAVQFDWHEDNLFGHSYDWHGRLDIGCGLDGTPALVNGSGKFYERFRQNLAVE